MFLCCDYIYVNSGTYIHVHYDVIWHINTSEWMVFVVCMCSIYSMCAYSIHVCNVLFIYIYFHSLRYSNVYCAFAHVDMCVGVEFLHMFYNVHVQLYF